MTLSLFSLSLSQFIPKTGKENGDVAAVAEGSDESNVGNDEKLS